MTIDRLRDVLGAVGPPPDARELSEMLWLACHISPPGDSPPGPPSPPRREEETGSEPGPATSPQEAEAPTAPSVPLTVPPPSPAPAAGPGAGEAAEVLVPTAPMLADPLGVQRALRPLKRRVPSWHRTEMDEDATAERIADTGLWTPVLVPSPERWLSLALVVDTGPTMRLWRPLARELTETLLRQGAFQDVHVSYLHPSGHLTSAPGAPPQDPGTLLDPSGRRAVLVLSDCSGPHWWDGRAARAVRRWAHAGPTAILQPLAEHLWRRTAAPASPGRAVLPRPGAPNTDLHFTPHDGAVAPGVPVPVLEVAPRWFGAWARLVSGAEPQPAAVTTLPARPRRSAPPERERRLPVAERVRRFLTTASPAAAELAAHVAVSVPSLPVMRLIQHRVLGRSGPGQLAEVLLSGLLRPAGGVRYEFVPGAREALLDTLPRPEAQHTRRVLEAVSAEIERRAGTAAETFRALLPAEGGPVTLTADTDHFALLTPETRTHLAPAPPDPPGFADIQGASLETPAPSPGPPSLLDIQGASVDELIGEDWDRPLGPVPIGVDDGLGTVQVDVLAPSDYGPYGLITGDLPSRDALLRTLVFGLALRHSPSVVTFALADFSGGAPYAGLRTLPHVVAAAHPTSADSPVFTWFPAVLETERRRREAVVRDAGMPSWDDYRAAVAGGAALEPLPALIVLIDNAGPLLEMRPDLIEPIAAIGEEHRAHGIRFIFCSYNAALPPRIGRQLAWQMGIPGAAGPGSAFFHQPGEVRYPGFRPAHISLDAVGPIVERMLQGPRPRKLPRPGDAAPPPAEPSPAPEPAPPPAVVPRFDVLRLNRGGTSGMFEETWARPPSEPRAPAIGYDPDGNVVTLYPLDIAGGTPHGLIVGETEARQHIVRNIALALAWNYSPGDLNFAFAGLRRHPLGAPLDLPHVAFSDDEMLGRPEAVQRFVDHLAGELENRSARPADAPGLVVFADVSLTFVSEKRELVETLLSLAQSGQGLGVRLLLSTSIVVDNAIWQRFLPLLGWRAVASRLPPAVLQQVLGQADLPFPDENTAYLRADGGEPRRFTPAPDPAAPAIDDFVRRTRLRGRVPPRPAEERDREAAALERMIAELDARVPYLETTEDHEYEAIDRRQVKAALLEILGTQLRNMRAGQIAPHRHLVVPGPCEPETTTVARLYGGMLAELGILSRGNLVSLTSSGAPMGDDPDPDNVLANMFRASDGSVLLVREPRGQDPDPGYLRPETVRRLIGAMDEGHDAALVVLTGDPADLRQVAAAVPEFRDRFTWLNALRAGTRRIGATKDPAVMEILQRLRVRETRTGRPEEHWPRHLVYEGTDMTRIAMLAEEYGRMLADRDVLAHGEVREATVDWLCHVADEPGKTMGDLFRESRGGVLLLHMTRESVGPAGASGEAIFPERLRSLVQEHGEDPVVIVCVDDGQLIGLRRFDPDFTHHYRRLREFPEVPDRPTPDLPARVHVSELPTSDGRRIPIGVGGGAHEPVYVDFDADPHLLIAGPPSSGRANTVRLLIDGITARDGGAEPRVHVFDAHQILLSLAEERGLTEAMGPGVGYTDSAEAFRETVARLRIDPPDGEVFLFVIDRDLDDDPLRTLPLDLLTSPGGRIHLVLTKLITVLDQPLDPMVSTLHELGAPALLLGTRYGEETRLYEARPPSRPGVPGRGVLVHRRRQRIIQVADVSPSPPSAM